jgi:hypothetical protein
LENKIQLAEGPENNDYRLLDGFLRYEFKPNVKRPYEAGMRITNSMGMANPEYTVEKPPHTRRIAILGDSVSVGPYGHDYAALLEARLNRDCRTPEIRNFQVLNFSVPGYVLFQEMDIALEKAPKFHPDVYIVALTSQEISGSRRDIAKLLENGTSLKYDFLRKEVEAAGIRPTDHRPVMVLKLLPYFHPMVRWALQQIRDHAAKTGAKLIVLLVPAAIDPATTASDFDDIRQGTDGLGVPVIDLRDTFRSANLNEIQVIPGSDVHPNARGHAMIFDGLYQQLRAQGVWAALAGAD